jgi:hypothetical protein
MDNKISFDYPSVKSQILICVQMEAHPSKVRLLEATYKSVMEFPRHIPRFLDPSISCPPLLVK